jgi:tetratricopeptide (TPR) repeat protein
MDNIIKKGELLFTQGDLTGAELHFGKILANDPNDKIARNNLGVIAFHQNNTETAIEHLKKSLDIDPLYKDAILNYCEILYAIQQPDKAISILTKAIRHYPDDVQIRYFRDDLPEKFREQFENSEKDSPAVMDIAHPKPIILGGCGSSGTTLLKTMLDAHEKIACGPELSFFDRPVLYRTKIGELHQMFNKQNFDALEKELHFPMVTPTGTYFGLFSPNAGKQYHSFDHIEKMFQMSRDLKHFLDLFFSNHAYQQKKRRWAEKTPNNIFCVQKVLDLFPDAYFVHVIRDGRDVALSLVEKRKFSLSTAIYRWLLAVEAGIRNRGHDRYLEIRYEDLVLDPENTLRALMQSLEEDFDPTMMNFWQKGKDNFLGYGSTPVFTKSVARWKTASIDPLIKEQMDWMMSDKLAKLGY